MFRWTTLLAATMTTMALLGCDPGTDSTAKSAGGADAGGSSGTAKTLRIAVIPKATSHEFWKSVESGAKSSAAALGAEVIWKGPVQESDRAGQIAIVQQFSTEGVDAICVAPLDKAALVPAVQQATAKKIPVVIFDSALDGTAGTDFVSFVATDNKEGGRMGGRKLVELLGGKGKVVLLRYAEGHASTGEREDGFLEIIKATPGIELIQENRYAGATAAEAQTASMNLADKLKQADGIFCPNESSTFGMLQALRQLSLAGKVKFVGFDSSSALLDALKSDEVHALVAQNPVKMGAEAVRVAIEKIQGKDVPATIDSGAALLTKDNLETPEVKAILGK